MGYLRFDDLHTFRKYKQEAAHHMTEIMCEQCGHWHHYSKWEEKPVNNWQLEEELKFENYACPFCKEEHDFLKGVIWR